MRPCIRLGDTVEFNTLITICLSIIQWGCSGKTLAFRIITRENYATRSADILDNLGVPNLKKVECSNFQFYVQGLKNRLVPDYFMCDMFKHMGDIHDHNTRQSEAD